MASHVTDHNGVMVPNYPLVNPNFVPVRYVVNPSVLAYIQSLYLQQLMKDEGLVPSEEEERKRDNVIRKLKQIVFEWIKSVAYRRLPQNDAKAASATILTYGSYGLGVYNAESDIDALCVAPRFATLTEDFFIDLHDMLAKRVEVSDIHCVKDARVPLMKFKFEGISVDLPYARLRVATVPQNVDILSPLFLDGIIDRTSLKSLSGVRANYSILKLVPNAKIFQELLRCVKHWAKRRGMYGNLFGFFGGIHLAVLAAFVCQTNPNVSLAGLVSIFFKTFAFWPWPAPVILQEGIMVLPRPIERRLLMPIQLPSSPHEYCHSNVTTSTFMKIKDEFWSGYLLTKDFFKFDWRNLFEPYPYSEKYHQFLKLCVSASSEDDLGDWIGWVKSRFPGFLQKLDEFLVVYDPNPTEYSDKNIQDPNVIFYWGIAPGVSNNLFDLDSVQQEFDKYLGTGSKGVKGKFRLSQIPSSQLPKNLQLVENPHVHSNPSQMVPVYTTPVPGHLGSGLTS